MIPVAIKGFNEIDALKVTIPQLIAIGVKEIVFFDGPFTEFKSEKDYSTDGTLEYLQNFDEITIIPCGRMNLMDKENKVFEVMASFNNVMILDCDEIIYGDWIQFNQVYYSIKYNYPSMFYGVAFTDMDMYYTVRTKAVRLFIDPKNWGVSDLHWHYKYKGERINLEKPRLIGGVHIIHDSSVRPKYREEQMNTFQKVYTPKENELYYENHGIATNETDFVQCDKCGCTHGVVFYTDTGKKGNDVGTRSARYIDIRCDKHKNAYKMPNH